MLPLSGGSAFGTDCCLLLVACCLLLGSRQTLCWLLVSTFVLGFWFRFSSIVVSSFASHRLHGLHYTNGLPGFFLNDERPRAVARSVEVYYSALVVGVEARSNSS